MRIKTIRKQLGLTQEELGKLLGVKNAAISKFETDRAIPTEAAIKLICSTYNVNYQWLTAGKEPIFLVPSEDELIIKYAPQAEEHLKSVFREMTHLTDSGWKALRDYIQYMLDAVDKIREDMPKDDEGSNEP